MNERYTAQEFLRDYDHALRIHTVPGYPAYEDRLRINNPDQLGDRSEAITLPYDASAPWALADFYPRYATKPATAGQFIDRGGSYPPTLAEAELWRSFGITQDQRHMPVHPFARQILEGGYTPEGVFVRPGGVVTPGFYCQRGRGPRKTTDMLLVAPAEGALHGLFIERADNGLLAIPGGHLEDEDTALSLGLGNRSEYEVGGCRELQEEAGVPIDPASLTCAGLTVVLQKIWAGPGADQRATLHAWPQGEAFAAILPAMPDIQAQASTDAKRADWLPLSESTLTRLADFSSHGTIGRRALAAYEEVTATHIAPDGSIIPW